MLMLFKRTLAVAVFLSVLQPSLAAADYAAGLKAYDGGDFTEALEVWLPLAKEGLDRWGVSAGERDRLLGVIEQRCLTHRNGASWQAETLHALEADGSSRQEALHEMLRRYLPLMHENRPVHEWPI